MSVRRVAALAALALVLAACGGASDAGSRVSTSGAPAASSDEPRTSAPADLLADADLADCPESDAAVAAREDGLPDLVLPCLGAGPAVRLAGLRGTPTVVNLWSTWCDACREEIPLLADLAAGGKVRVLGVDVDDDPASAVSLLTQAGAHYPSVRDDDRATQVPLGWVGLPMTLFVDADGVVTFTQRGAVEDSAALARLVREHLGVEVAS